MVDISLMRFLRWNRFNPAAGIRQILPNASKISIRDLLAMNFRNLDSLQPNQQLSINDQLKSNNNLVNLIMQDDGNLVLYRTHYGQKLWASETNFPVDHMAMRDDGNLVAYSAQGDSYWDTGTHGHPGAVIVLQDDGNLVIYDSANKPLWASNTVQNFLSPTYRYQDTSGYEYIETSESWKDLCRVLPCFGALHWPDYDTKVIDRIDGQPLIIDGQHVVIQLWKGWCQQFLGLKDFPGGVGAEVGIYRRIPGKPRPKSLGFLPKILETFILDSIASLSDEELWWPYPELNAKIEFTLVNPVTNQPFFSAGPENSYWLAKWMDFNSYSDYQEKHSTPTFSAEYLLDYKINGKSYPRW